jgi:hypothetical protein
MPALNAERRTEARHVALTPSLPRARSIAKDIDRTRPPIARDNPLP